MALIMMSQLGQLGGVFHSQSDLGHSRGVGGGIVTDLTDLQGSGGVDDEQVLLDHWQENIDKDVLCKEVSWLEHFHKHKMF